MKILITLTSILSIGFLYFLYSSSNKSYNTFNWTDDTLFFFGGITIAIVMITICALGHQFDIDKLNNRK